MYIKKFFDDDQDEEEQAVIWKEIVKYQKDVDDYSAFQLLQYLLRTR